jgi:hypothetical protein
MAGAARAAAFRRPGGARRALIQKPGLRPGAFDWPHEQRKTAANRYGGIVDRCRVVCHSGRRGSVVEPPREASRDAPCHADRRRASLRTWLTALQIRTEPRRRRIVRHPTVSDANRH